MTKPPVPVTSVNFAIKVVPRRHEHFPLHPKWMLSRLTPDMISLSSSQFFLRFSLSGPLHAPLHLHPSVSRPPQPLSSLYNRKRSSSKVFAAMFLVASSALTALTPTSIAYVPNTATKVFAAKTSMIE